MEHCGSLHVADVLVPEPGVEIERVFEELLRYKSPGIDYIPAELV